jgi:diadenosine tetraphosphate (Ap4A) HIT family hydrolase
MSRERWDALVRGEGCPLCAEVAAVDPMSAAHAEGTFEADLSIGRLRLATNQWIPSYCVLISRIHVGESYELATEDRARYFDDLMRAAQAIERVFQPVKMNYEILGNAVLHLHCHLTPRYYGDPAPNIIIDQNAGQQRLTSAEYAERVERTRTAL